MPSSSHLVVGSVWVGGGRLCFFFFLNSLIEVGLTAYVTKAGLGFLALLHPQML